LLNKVNIYLTIGKTDFYFLQSLLQTPLTLLYPGRQTLIITFSAATTRPGQLGQSPDVW
jgi:hypothetical protein